MKTLLFGLGAALFFVSVAKGQDAAAIGEGAPKPLSPAVQEKPRTPSLNDYIYERRIRVWTALLKDVNECQTVVSGIQQQGGNVSLVSEQLRTVATRLDAVHEVAAQQLAVAQETMQAKDWGMVGHDEAWRAQNRARAENDYSAGQSSVEQIKALQASLGQIKSGSLPQTEMKRLAGALDNALDSAQAILTRTPAEKREFLAIVDKGIEDRKRSLAEYDRWWEREKVITAQQNKEIKESRLKTDALFKKMRDQFDSLPEERKTEETRRFVADYDRRQKERAARLKQPQQPTKPPEPDMPAEY